MIVVVFDVESVGLHGEGFAAGAVVVDTETGETLEEFAEGCHPGGAIGTAEDREWVMNNLPGLIITHPYPGYMRDAFWTFWRKWADQGAFLLADCAWPVEANFLSSCIAHDPHDRKWQGPYPLLDLAPILWAQGIDPKGTFGRLENELPVHDPLADARQTARLLLEALKRQKDGLDEPDTCMDCGSVVIAGHCPVCSNHGL